MKCTTCQLNEATIYVMNRGDFCLNCHNEMIAALQGIEKSGEFAEIVSMEDVDGVCHQFEISNMILPDMTVWRAAEIDGDYQFEIIAKPEDKETVAFENLQAKIEKGLSCKTLERLSDRHLIDNVIRMKKGQYGLKSVGTGRISYDAEEDTACLVIDGEEVSLYDFRRALTTFEGFNLDFQIRDISDDVLGKETVLCPVSINPVVIFERFEKTLGWFLEGDFLSYKWVRSCEDSLFERIDELELLHKYGDKETAEKVGERIKKRLLSIEHDDDHFPEYLLMLIDQVLEG